MFNFLKRNKQSKQKENPMGYKLGKKSMENLKGVHPDMVKVVKRAIELTEQDFTVHSGVRTAKEQNALYQKGRTKPGSKVTSKDGYKRKSNHQAKADGYGHAVDIVPYINGKLKWDWPALYVMAEAMTKAATELGVAVRWGGSWDVINDKSGSPKSWVDAYGARKRAQGKRSFPDGPHYELA